MSVDWLLLSVGKRTEECFGNKVLMLSQKGFHFCLQKLIFDYQHYMLQPYMLY